MLTYYHIKNFKSLRNVDITPTNLNLMLGLNSMGKSSIIQSLLLLNYVQIITLTFKQKSQDC